MRRAHDSTIALLRSLSWGLMFARYIKYLQIAESAYTLLYGQHRIRVERWLATLSLDHFWMQCDLAVPISAESVMLCGSSAHDRCA